MNPRALIRLEHREEALRLMIEAVQKAETTQHPILILEALLEIGRDMRELDARRARDLLHLALRLGKTIRNPSAQKIAQKLFHQRRVGAVG